jgi:hypothetical protein
MKPIKTGLWLTFSAVLIVLLETACTKDPVEPANITKTIQFVLYTEADFSTNTDSIFFSVFIKNHRTTLFDSALAPMAIKDIPGIANKLIVEKKVTDTSTLAVGFLYTIKNVGFSWYTDTCAAGEAFKSVVYSFK